MANNTIFKERIAKRISSSGICSRREAEKIILEGRVKVNGLIIEKPNLNVSDKDSIFIDNKLIPTKPKTRVWIFHKPKNCLVTNSDEKGRQTIFDLLPQTLPRVVSVGRLDFDTEGLILLTNSGDLARKLELPKNGLNRRYRVRVHGYVDRKNLEELKNGIRIHNYNYGPKNAILDFQKNSNAWLTINLKEGKNREIRIILDHLGYPVNRLIRISYGPFHLGDLLPKGIIEVSSEVLSEKVGHLIN